MKKTILSLLSIIILSILSIIIYWNLPFEIKRKSDIKFGNKLIENIEQYRKVNNQIPKNDDWKTLKRIGFEFEYLATTKPNYQADRHGNYELIYLEGFDGPYLMWNSKEKKWKMGNPTIFAN